MAKRDSNEAVQGQGAQGIRQLRNVQSAANLGTYGTKGTVSPKRNAYIQSNLGLVARHGSKLPQEAKKFPVPSPKRSYLEPKILVPEKNSRNAAS